MKGNIMDISVIIIMAVVMPIVVLLSYTIYVPISQSDLNTAETTEILADTEQGLLTFDSVYVMVLIGILSMSLVSAFFIDTHPIFFIVFLVMSSVMLLVSAIFSNVFSAFISASPISSYISAFPMMNFIGTNLPFVIFGFMLLLGGVLYAKKGGMQ